MQPRLLVPVALAAAVLIAVGIWPGGHPAGRAYGMTDIPELIHAGVLHVRGEMFMPAVVPPGQERTRVEYEYWVDANGSRCRHTMPTCSIEAGKTVVTLGERVMDGEYVMTVDHAARTVMYTRLNELRRALETRRSLARFYEQLFGGQMLDAFHATGFEIVAGVKYTVWEYTTEEPLLDLAFRIECLMDRATGAIGGARAFVRQGTAGDWQLAMRMWPWEHVADPPTGVFDTTPPAGYTLVNTKETAELASLAYEGGTGTGNGITNRRDIAFRLPDGSVLLAWGSQDLESEESQAKLFAGLEFGGPLPRLPMEITGLRQEIDGRTITYTGRHVAWSRHGDDFVEWSLYIPLEKPPARWQIYYRVEQRFNVEPGRITPLITSNVSQPFFIDGAADFDELVRGAMTELSDDGPPPADITLERVLTMAAKVHGAAADPSEHE